MATLSPAITILNVDDHEISRYGKSRALREAGFEVKEALTGRQALQVVRHEHPPLVLLDVHLPDIDGLEVCRQIKNDPNLASTLVLQISASSIASQDRIRGLEGGADTYLTEPIEPGELVAHVRALLRIYQAEQALARVNETLEQRVRERTALLQLLHEILAAVNEMETVEEALHFALDRICTYTQWPVGHVYWVNRQNPDELISSKIWHLDDPERFEPFRQASEVVVLRRGAGLPGQVLASGELNWVVDMAQLHPHRAPAALQSGLQIGFGFPLWAGQEMVAILEFYTTEAVEPNGAFLEVMTQIGTQLGRVVERRRAEDQLRRLNTELEQRVSERTAQLEAANRQLAEEIRQHKQAEAAVRESEARFRAMADVSPVVIWVTWAQGGVDFVNRAYLDFFGVTLEQVQGPNWQPLVHPDDAEVYIGEFEAALREQRPFHAQARVRHASGEWRWIASYAAPRFSSSGEFLGYVGSSPDINEMKLVQEALAESKERFRAVQELSLYAFTILKAVRNPAGQIVDFEWEYANPAAGQILRRPKEELIGRRLLEVLPGNKSESDLFERYIRVVETGQPHDIELAYNADGIKGWFRNMTVKLGDGVAVSFSDITRQKRTQLGEHLLAEAGKILTSSLDYTVQLSNIAHLAVPHLADWCVVDLYDADWTVQPIAMAHIDPAKVELANEVRRRYPSHREKLKAETWPWQKGQAEVYPVISEAMLQASAQDAEHYQLLRDLQLRSAMVVPLVGRERVLGLITFFSVESDHRYDEQDLALAEELARRVSLSLENAYSYAAEQQARQETEETAQHIAALQVITASLSEALTPAQVARVVVEQGLAALEAEGGVVALLDQTGPTLEVLASVGYPDEMIEKWRRFPLTAETLLSEAARTQELVLVESLEELAARYPHLTSNRSVSYQALIAAPLVVRDRMLGSLGISFIEAQAFTPESRAFALALAQQCAQAMERARLYQAEQQARQVAEEATERTIALQMVTAALSRALTSQQIFDVIVQQGITALGADSGAVMLINEDGTALEGVGHVGYPEATVKAFQIHPLSRESMVKDAVLTGQPVWNSSHTEYAARYPDLASTRATSQKEASAVAPLVVEGRTLGIIALSFAEVHDFSPEEKDFLVALASLCAQALERARLYEVEQQARAEAEANQQRLALLAEMRERSRMAQELHDTVAQALGYLNLKLSMVNSLLKDDQLDLVKENLQELKKVVSETYTDVREEIFYLRAQVLSDLSFLELLERYVDKYRRFYHLDIQLIQEADPTRFEFSPEATSQLIRSIQEALINIRKHSHVDKANIRLGCQEDGQICIVIEDEGQGFDLAEVKEKISSFGLQIMGERIESIGGSLEVNTTPGQGTRVILHYQPERGG